MLKLITVQKIRDWLQIRRQEDAMLAQPDTSLTDVEKGEVEAVTPNLRALRLAMTISDTLLSMGVPAASVVSRALDVTAAY